MLRAGKWARLGAGIGGLAVCLTALAPGVARADGGPLSFASMLAPPTTFTAQYSCDLSAYGSGIPPVTVSATVTVPKRAQTFVAVPVSLQTTSVALPSSVLSQLSGVVSFDLMSTVTEKQNLGPVSVPLSGQIPVSGTLTGLPAAIAQASDANPVQFLVPGTGKVEVPLPTLTFTPHTSAAALSAITCTTTATKRDIPVTVTDVVIGPPGPLYKGVLTGISAATHTKVEVAELLAHVPMTVTGSGTRTVGNTVTVRLVAGTSDLLGALLTLFGATSVRFFADLPVLGAQPGKIALSEPITDLRSAAIQASGQLRLTKAGNDRILIPEKFTFTFNRPVQGGEIPLVLTFTIKTSPVPVGLTLKVAKAHASPQPSPSPTPTSSGGQPQGGGTPSGAPGTGGGTGPGGDMAVAAGGLAMVLSGGGLLVLTRRRRRKGW
jgi:hypothetical protein